MLSCLLVLCLLNVKAVRFVFAVYVKEGMKVVSFRK